MYSRSASIDGQSASSESPTGSNCVAHDLVSPLTAAAVSRATTSAARKGRPERRAHVDPTARVLLRQRIARSGERAAVILQLAPREPGAGGEEFRHRLPRLHVLRQPVVLARRRGDGRGRGRGRERLDRSWRRHPLCVDGAASGLRGRSAEARGKGRHAAMLRAAWPSLAAGLLLQW